MYLRLDLQQGEWLRLNCATAIACTEGRVAKRKFVATVGYSAGRVAEREFWSDI